jgi:hypothetical protein
VAYREVNHIAAGIGLFLQAVRLASAIGAGLIALAGMALALRISEFADAAAMLQLRVRKLLTGSL